jgi:hypothetical protein
MSTYAGGAGYAGNVSIGTPSGGGAFKYSSAPGPVPGVYANHYPVGSSSPEPSGGSAWSEVGVYLGKTAIDVLAAKYLTRDTADNRGIPGGRGELGAVPEPMPRARLADDPAPVREPRPATAPIALTPATIGLMAAGVLVLGLLIRK